MKTIKIIIQAIVIIGALASLIGAFIMSGRESPLFYKYYKNSVEYKNILEGIESLKKMDYKQNNGAMYGFVHFKENGFKELSKIIIIYRENIDEKRMKGIYFSPIVEYGDNILEGYVQIAYENDKFMTPITTLGIFEDWIERYYQRKAIEIGGWWLFCGFVVQFFVAILIIYFEVVDWKLPKIKTNKLRIK